MDTGSTTILLVIMERRAHTMKKRSDTEKRNSEKRHTQEEGPRAPEKLSPYVAMALKGGMDDAVIVETSKVFTAPWVRMKCQFGCAGYGQRLCCPPYSPNPEQTRAILDSYTRGILLHRHWQKGYKTVKDFNDVLVDMERAVFLDGFHKAFSMGSGPCTRCAACNISGGCVHPEKTRPAMEACGIDVFATVREHGLPISVVRNRNEERNIFGLVLVE
jgi:predicted metal-binding protein